MPMAKPDFYPPVTQTPTLGETRKGNPPEDSDRKGLAAGAEIGYNTRVELERDRPVTVASPFPTNPRPTQWAGDPSYEQH